MGSYFYDNHQHQHEYQPGVNLISVALVDDSDNQCASAREKRDSSRAHPVHSVAFITGFFAHDKNGIHTKDNNTAGQHNHMHHVGHPYMKWIKQSNKKRY